MEYDTTSGIAEALNDRPEITIDRKQSNQNHVSSQLKPEVTDLETCDRSTSVLIPQHFSTFPGQTGLFGHLIATHRDNEENPQSPHGSGGNSHAAMRN